MDSDALEMFFCFDDEKKLNKLLKNIEKNKNCVII